MGWAGEGERSKSREGGGEGKWHTRGGGRAAVSEEEQTEWHNRDNRKNQF